MRAALPLALLVAVPALAQGQTAPAAPARDTATAASRPALFPPLAFQAPTPPDSLRRDLGRRRWDDAREGAVLGALAGALHGAALTQVEQPCERDGGSFGASPLAGAAGGAVFGAIGGAVRGWLGRGREATAPPSSGTTTAEPRPLPRVVPRPQCTADGRIDDGRHHPLP